MIWELKEQSRVKHELLAEYLRRWFPILAQRRPQGERILYIDGFAGPGRYPGGESGSPLVALTVALEHKLLPKLLQRPRFEAVWVFIEADKTIHSHLSQELEAYLATKQPPGKFTIHSPILGQFNEQMTSVLSMLEEQRKRLAPAFVFVDPFGPAGFPLTTIERIMKNPSCEVLIRFNYTRLANTFLQRRDMEARIDELYACDLWRQARSLRGAPREEFLISLYRDQLTGHAGVGFVQPFRIVDATGHIAYFIFSTNSPHGLEEMKEAMWKIDPEGLFSWRATRRRHPDQSSFVPLLAEGECIAQLAEKISTKFAGKRVRVDMLEEFVMREAIVILRHLRPSLGALEERRKITSVERPGGKARRKGTFPPDAWVTFG